jgi:hypothetical protein
VISFTPQSLYPQGKNPWYPLNRRLGGPQSRSGHGGEEKNSQSPPGIEPRNPDRPARSLVAIQTEPSSGFTKSLLQDTMASFHIFLKTHALIKRREITNKPIFQYEIFYLILADYNIIMLSEMFGGS